MNTDAGSQQQILLVDDLPDNLKILRNMLSKQNYEIRMAVNGNIAIASVQEEPPDLILLDIRMPDMDGYEVCRRFKADETLKDIPVIFISALSEPIEKVKAFEAGGVDYITKPFHAEEVLSRVKTHLSLRSMHKELLRKNAELQEALDSIKTLQGMLPICSYCKKIRDDKGYWNQIEEYITEHSGAIFSHGLCPQCTEKTYGNENWYKKRKHSGDQKE
jgi:PleD family two-component response regulator